MQNKPRVVIVGGGFGGLFTALDMKTDANVTLISDEDHFLFTPMLYEYFSGEVEAWHIAPQYRELVDDLNFVRGLVTKVDLDARRVHVELGPSVDKGKAKASQGQELTDARSEIEYDILVLAPGGTTNYWGIPGAEAFTIPFRKLAHADRLRTRMVEALDRVAPNLPPQDTRSALTFAVTGAGASGVELSTKMADLLRDAFQRRALTGEPRVLLIEMGDRVVPGMGEEIREYVSDALQKSRVEVHTLTRVVRATATTLVFEHGGTETEIETAAVVWTAGVRMNPIIENLKAEKSSRGLLLVRQTLQLKDHDNVFSLGDVAYVKDIPPILAGTAQLAFQEASLLARNVKAFSKDQPLQTGKFEELGEAVSLGTERAAVLAGGKAFGGPLARQARFALYTSRLPTWQHRLRVGASWFFEGTIPRPLLPLGYEHDVV